MLQVILNKSWRQHPTKQQLYSHLPPITKTIKIRRTRHAAHCWRSRDELISDVLQWTPSHGRAKAGRPTWTYIQQLCLRTCRKQWTIEKGGKRVSGISVLMVRYDDDDDGESEIVKTFRFKRNKYKLIIIDRTWNRMGGKVWWHSSYKSWRL